MRRIKSVTLLVVITLLFALTLPAGAQEDTSSLKGKPAPDFTFHTLDGKTVQLSKEKGNVVFLDYWATWCPPCRASLHHVQKLSQDKERAAKGLKVYAINDKEQAATVKSFLKQNNYTFTVPMDHHGVFGRKYKVRGIPTTIIVGRDGIIKDVFIGYDMSNSEASNKPMEKAVDNALSESK